MEESSIFLSFLLFLLIILFTSTDIHARELQQNCSFSCGDIKNISYPFRLKDNPTECGDRDYELSCESNKTILEYLSGKYYVKRISYDEQIISLVDVNVANGIGGLPYRSMSRPGSYREYLYEIVNGDRYLIFINCSMDITDPKEFPNWSKIQSNVYAGFSSSRDYYTVSDVPNSCGFISSVPIHMEKELSGIIPFEAIRKSLESGFNCTWSVKCRDCRAQGGFCSNERDSIHCDKSANIFLYFEGILGAIISFIYYIVDYDEAAKELSEYDLPAYYIPVELSVQGVRLFTICRFIVAPIVLLVFLVHKYITTLKRVDNVEKFLHSQQSWMLKRYSYPEIIAITNHFQHKLGQGGFGSVYKGQLHSGGLIAVKMLENSKFSAEEFINEVSTIGRIHHVNIVQLLGFCSEGSKRALVYEYMPNGSLDRHIFSKKGEGRRQSFSWEKIHEIALGTARGIEYLHGGCDVCILHFDIKPHNILLDHNFIPKVSDFGLAKFYPKENDFVSISATRGTIGYIAPELISRNFGTVSCKSDVYSFGMLLLEMAGGRRNSNMMATHSSKAYFPSWVYDQISKGGDLELRNVTEIESMIARKLCMIGLWCIQVKAGDRPSMIKVIEMLEGNIEDLQMPPRPFFSSSSSSQQISRGEIESASSTELLISGSIEECSPSDSYV